MKPVKKDVGAMPLITSLGRDIYRSMSATEPERTSATDRIEKVAVIETGPSNGTDISKDALKHLGIPR
jgi:hypothetical protein